MQIEKVQLVQFRNYKDLDLEFSPGVNVLLVQMDRGRQIYWSLCICSPEDVLFVQEKLKI